MRTREGTAVAKAKGRSRGKRPKPSTSRRKRLLALHDARTHTQADLAEPFNVSRTGIYREVQRRDTASGTAGRPVSDALTG